MRVAKAGLNLKSWLDVSTFLLTNSEQLSKGEKNRTIADRIETALGKNFQNALNSLTSDRLSDVASRSFLNERDVTIKMPPPEHRIYSDSEINEINEEFKRQVEIVRFKQLIVCEASGQTGQDRVYGWLREIIRLENEGKTGQDNSVLVRQFSLLKSAVEAEITSIISQERLLVDRERHYDPPNIPEFILKELDKEDYQGAVGVKNVVLALIDKHASNLHLVDDIPVFSNG